MLDMEEIDLQLAQDSQVISNLLADTGLGLFFIGVPEGEGKKSC